MNSDTMTTTTDDDTMTTTTDDADHLVAGASHADAGPDSRTDLPDPREALSERLFGDLVGALELFAIHVGRATGLYDALVDGPVSGSDLVSATGLDGGYVAAWLDQQVAAGMVVVDDPDRAPAQRRHHLQPATAEVLLDDTSPYHMGPAGPFAVSVGRATPGVVDAFHTGGGVAYADYGPELRRAIAAFNRPMIEAGLVDDWLPAVPRVRDHLVATAAPRILDLGCGLGRTTVELARAFPNATVCGLDLDEASISEARDLAAQLGLADRVTFVTGDATTWDTEDRFELVTSFESLHDTADPVATLATARRLLAPGGAVLVGDDRGADHLETPADPYQRMLHGFAVLHCIPATRSEDASHAHGPVVRRADVLGWIERAGFASGEVVDIDEDMWRFYLATP